MDLVATFICAMNLLQFITSAHKLADYVLSFAVIHDSNIYFAKYILNIS